jgi:hypothetical protein
VSTIRCIHNLCTPRSSIVLVFCVLNFLIFPPPLMPRLPHRLADTLPGMFNADLFLGLLLLLLLLLLPCSSHAHHHPFQATCSPESLCAVPSPTPPQALSGHSQLTGCPHIHQQDSEHGNVLSSYPLKGTSSDLRILFSTDGCCKSYHPYTLALLHGAYILSCLAPMHEH